MTKVSDIVDTSTPEPSKKYLRAMVSALMRKCISKWLRCKVIVLWMKYQS